MSHESAGHSLSCLLQEYTIENDGTVRFVMGYLVEHPSQCQDLCSRNFFGPYIERVIDNNGGINNRFDQLLNPVYTTLSASSNNQCSTFTTTPNTLTRYISKICLLYTSPSPRDKRQSRMPSSA